MVQKKLNPQLLRGAPRAIPAEFWKLVSLSNYFFNYVPKPYHEMVKKQLIDELNKYNVTFDQYLERNIYTRDQFIWGTTNFPFEKVGQEFSERVNNEYKARQAAWILLSKTTQDFEVSQQMGSPTWMVFGGPLLKGKESFALEGARHIADIISKKYSSQNEKEKVVSQYKIHLMPKWEDLSSTIMNLFETIKKNSQLQNAIGHMKCSVLNVDLYDNDGQVVPRIVIYAADGKENAQLILDTVYALFKNQQGANITPRYNQRVTSLIYFAQSHADVKKRLYKKHFETDEKIYFHPDTTPSGVGGGYHLRIPSDS